MVMKNEEQLNRYFESGMSGTEEQNFLISVAASDELRRAFRSQLELIKAVRSDKDALHSGRDGDPVAMVRTRTLVALGLSATAAMPFLNGDNTHALQSASASLSGEPVVAKVEALPGHVSLMSRMLGRSTLALATGLALGVMATLGIEQLGNENSTVSLPSASAVHGTVNSSAIPVQPSNSEQSVPTGVSRQETISAGNGLVSSASHSTHANHRGTEAAHRGTIQSAATPAPASIPTVTTSGTASIHANKLKIKKPNDTGVGN
ncbi:MAG TPA: hypothetical protein VGM92_04820 [Candidatus Kapabacteria bacterium]